MINELTQERLKEVLHYEPQTGLFRWKKRLSNRIKVGDIAGHVDYHGYVVVRIDGVIFMAHRLAWLYVNGVFPTKGIDHINRIKSDNSFSNLREAAQSENLQNRGKGKNNKTGYTGVSYNKKREYWYASICIKGKTIPLGNYNNPYEAANAYAQAKKIHHTFHQEVSL